MNNILSELQNIETLAISGHIKPDGDCVGALLSMYNYIVNNYKNITVDLFLEPIPKIFCNLKNSDKIISDFTMEKEYDLFISLDCGDEDRLGGAVKYFKSAKKTINIDHHISNTNFANINHVILESSSTCEVLYDIYEEDKIDLDIATALYIGIVHDTGVFKHTNTTQKTMNIAGNLISLGVNFSKIIDETFYQKTYIQNQILGRCLLESMLVLNGKCIVSTIKRKDLEFYGANLTDLSGITDQLRVTSGIEVAVLISETNFQEYKVSMRSNNKIDVNKVAKYFGGGGHIKAAGCNMKGTTYDVINNLTKHIEAQLIDTDEYTGE